jgi:hypothetical protein
VVDDEEADDERDQPGDAHQHAQREEDVLGLPAVGCGLFDLRSAGEPRFDGRLHGDAVATRRDTHVDAIDTAGLAEEALGRWQIHQADAAAEQGGRTDGIDEPTHDECSQACRRGDRDVGVHADAVRLGESAAQRDRVGATDERELVGYLERATWNLRLVLVVGEDVEPEDREALAATVGERHETFDEAGRTRDPGEPAHGLDQVLGHAGAAVRDL